MKRLSLFLCALLVCAVLSGCGDIGGIAQDDRKFMVSAIGFDEEEGQLKTAVELIVINGENYESAAETRVITAKGENIEETLDTIASSLTKPMLLNHCGIIAIGEKIGKERFAEICDYAFYDERITLSAYMVTAQDCETLLTGKPEASVAVGYDMMGIIEQESAQSGVAYNSRFFEVEEQREDKKESFSLPHFVREKERMKADGMTVFYHDRQIARLTIEESALYALITGELRKGTVSVGAGDYKIDERKLDWGQNRVTLKLGMLKGNENKLENTIMSFKKKMEQESGLDFFGLCALLNQREPDRQKRERDFETIDFSVICYPVKGKQQNGTSGTE